MIFVSSDGTPDNVPIGPQNRHGTLEKVRHNQLKLGGTPENDLFHFNSCLCFNTDCLFLTTANFLEVGQK